MAILALGGGGSGGFGGGGFGGGGGGFGFGGGLIFGPAWLVAGFFILRFLFAMYMRDAQQRRSDGRPPLTLSTAFAALTLLLLWPLDLLREWMARRHRTRQVQLAAAEAAEEEPMFAPETVRLAGEALFRDVQAAWSQDDRTTLGRLAGDTLTREWYLRLADFASRGWRNEVEIIGDVQVEYVGLVNTGDPRADEVCVRIVARVRDIVKDRMGRTVRRRGSMSEAHRICQYWTLTRPDGRWIVGRIEEHREGLHQLHEPIVATPWGDDARLHREATVEQAVAASIPAGDLAAIGRPEIDEGARLAALDLSLVDGRFAPDVLTAEARYAVAAWAGAVDGDRAPLEAIASAPALAELLYADDPTQSTRLVVRGLQVTELRIVGIASDSVPARMTVEVHATGIVYTEDRSTLIVVDGDRARRRPFSQRWTLELGDDGAHPWRIVSATAPVRG